MRLVAWTTAIYLVLTPWAWAASFDCKKASTFVERAICSSKVLSAMDDQLGRLYAKALAGAPNDAKLKTDQKSWLSLRNQCRDSDCLKTAYEDRLTVLGVRPASSPGALTGTYELKGAHFTGVVLIQQLGGRIKFAVDATYRTNKGEVSGEIPLTGDTAKFVDPDWDCELSFKFAPTSLQIAQNGLCGMGLNVSAQGTYHRVSAALPNFDE
jgi:uncharacterized protein